MKSTFDDTLNAPTPIDLEVAEVKRTFDQTLAVLHEHRKSLPKRQAGWEQRLALVRHRRAQALQRGVKHPELEHVLVELDGNGLMPGVLSLLDGDIANCIRMIESFDAQLLPHRSTWMSWSGQPARIQDVINHVAARVEQAEAIVKEGGELHRMLDARVNQAADS
jgi:hypothetical protein